MPVLRRNPEIIIGWLYQAQKTFAGITATAEESNWSAEYLHAVAADVWRNAFTSEENLYPNGIQLIQEHLYE